MKKIVSLILSFILTINIFSGIDFTAFAQNNNLENEFTSVSSTDLFYGYTWYLASYNNEMRKPITDSIVNAGEEFGLDDKFLASLETSLDTVGSFSKTFYALTDAAGLTSKMNNDAADIAINDVLKNIYGDQNSDFWNTLINMESKSIEALDGSLSFIDNFNQANFENYTLNEIYEEILMSSINKTCEYDVALGKLSITNRNKISKTVLDYYGDYLSSWDQIIKLTKCINTILFYQNVEVELIDYMLEFEDLDEDLIKGLKRIKSYITTNYATYFAEKITKDVIDKTLDKIGSFLGYNSPLVQLVTTACEVGGWLIFDVIYKHADAKEYLTYLYLVKFLYSAQYEMNKKLHFLHTDLVYSKTIDDFEYFYKIYAAIFKISKDYAEKLLPKDIDFVYQESFFDYSKFIEYTRVQVEAINVHERVEKAYISNKTYQFNEPIVISDSSKDTTCLVTFHNKIMAPLIIDSNVSIDDCNITVPKLEINRSLNIRSIITVEGNCSAKISNCELRIFNGGLLDIKGNADFGANLCDDDSVAKIVIDKGGQIIVGNNFIFTGMKSIGYGFNYAHLYVYGQFIVNGNLEANSVTKLFNYGNVLVKGNANFIAQTHWVNVTHGYIYIYSGANFLTGGNLTIKGSRYYNTGNNWFSLYIYGYLQVDGDLDISEQFVSFNQTSSDSVLRVKGNFNLDVLNDTVIYGFSVGSCKGYLSYFSAGTLFLGGNYNNKGANVTPSGNYTVVFNGEKTQTINKLTSPIIIIDNPSGQGVIFNSAINPNILFNHNGNNFTVTSSSVFTDYDFDGLKDNVDPQPTVGFPVTIYIKSNNTEQGTVSIDKIETYSGSEITITATPSSKYEFSGWANSSGSIVSYSKKYTFIAKKDGEIFTALFHKRLQPIFSHNEGGILITDYEAEIESLVTVEIIENDGYIYKEGSLKYNDIEIENNSFIMPDEPVYLTAEFIRNEHYFALRDMLSVAKSYTYESYTEESFKVLVNTIANAEQALVNNISEEDSLNNIQSLQSAIDALEVKEIPEFITVYFENSKFWGDINYYAWGGAEDMEWPGAPCTHVYGDVWSATIPGDSKYIIFNDGIHQTADMAIVGDNKIAHFDGSFGTNDYGDSWPSATWKDFYARGDATLDGSITILDATEIQQSLVELIMISEAAMFIADVNDDGIISIMDATLIQMYIAQIVPSL